MKIHISLCLTFVALGMTVQADAQEFRSTIAGRVIDAQQASVPQAKVTGTNIETGVKYDTVSGQDGAYTLPFLQPGKYSVTATSTGFKAYIRKEVEVTANARVQLDIMLEVGSATEVLTVTAEVPALESATASTGQVINSKQMDLLPSNGRTPLVLAQLASGVIPTGTPQFVRPFDNGTASSLSMGGAPASSNELLIDGAPNIGNAGAVAFNPPMDAVTEVKAESFQADAAYGHTGGGTINVLLKSGTNQLHGSMYEYNQNTALAASSWFLNAAAQKKTVSQYNQWGATAGGPVWLPKVIDGRNRLFFFFGYEGVRNGLPRPAATSVPTEAERAGDLSALLKIGSQYQIYDPASGVVQGSRVARSPFPNNLIPAGSISPISKKFMQFLPLPNNFVAADGTNDYLSNQVEMNKFYSTVTRVDLNLNDRNKIYFNIRHNLRTVNLDLLHNEATNYYQQRINWGGQVEDVITLTPTTVWSIRANYTRYALPTIAGSDGFDVTQFGLPQYLRDNALRQKMPYITFSTMQYLGNQSDASSINETYQVFSTLVKLVGNHNLKAGADLRMYRNSASSFGNSTGAFNFGANWTLGPLDNSPAAPIGQDWASFLLGLPTSGSYDLNTSSIYQAGYYSLFLQDDFRVRPNLTLNLGLRYERDLPTTERFDRTTNGFDTTTPSVISAAAKAAYAKAPIPQVPISQFQVNGGLLFAGPGNRSAYHTESNNFSPRFGFAWKPSFGGQKTVVRGGVGVYYFAIGATGINQPGFSQSTSLVATTNGFLSPAATLADPFPGGIIQPPGASQGLATYLGKSITYNNPAPLNPYSTRWTFNVQRSLPGQITVELGYQGNHALHLSDNMSLNYVPAQFLSTSPFRDQATINLLSSNVANPFSGLIPGSTISGSTIGLSSLLTAYPQYTGVTENGLNEGSSYFHMGSVRLEKRFSHGLTLMANYQMSKLLGRFSRLNNSDLQLAKQVAGEDRPQRVVVAVNYELPFGRGKAIASRAPRVVNGVIGGWIVNAVFTSQIAGPLSWGNILYYGGDLHLNAHAVTGAFDTTLFDRKTADQLASNIRTFPFNFGNLRTDSPINVDASAIKQFPIHERLRMEYRCEFFNAFNHPVFSAPNTTPTSSAFATTTSVTNLARVIQMSLRFAW